MSLNNLKAELKRNGLDQQSVADFLGMGRSNFNRKLAEAVPFTNHEMFAIRDEFFPKKSLDYLFQSDGDIPTKQDVIEERNKMRTFRGISGELEVLGPALEEVCDEAIAELNEEIARREARGE